MSLEVYLGECRSSDQGDWINLIISGGSCDQGFTPVEDLPLFEGRVEFGVVSIDCLCHGRARRWSRPRLTHDSSTTPPSSPLKSPIQFQPLQPHFTLYIQYSTGTWVSPSAQSGIKSRAPVLSLRLTVVKSWSRRSRMVCCVKMLEAIECLPLG